ncbi:benzoate 4-monooxygenase cytochrome P450 [Aspergillus bombycis]|uniref:Benzoate 4-monooxygenase cytochrome P450 n=1 Tax=Aspergillus bombycis TaxID=109264 RepID=A0A1F8A6Q5_9EURO|nr:benzoate 4-monooxygenase cytochrome P450 [Aspergillus bombycis]OGM47432.1 benzoate 4-monooxygenase cytochrome P450 [Aspergillus bombycis]
MDSPRLWLALIGLVIYPIAIGIYRLYSHPLRKIPGPKLAAVTHLYEWYYDLCLGGRYLFEIERMHERYGPIVRINPREVHISDPHYYDEIYASGTQRRNKDAKYVSFTGMPLSTASTVDHGLHRYRRGLVNSFFSKKSIRVLSRLVEEKVHKLMQRFEAFHRDNEVVRVDDAFAAMTSDVITHYCYGKSWGYLEDANLRTDVRKAVHDLSCSVHFNRIFPIFIAMLTKLPLRLLRAIHPGRSVVLDIQKAIYEQSAEAFHGDKYSLGHDDMDGKHKTIYDQLTDPSIPPEERSLQRLQDEGLLLISAGTETTARALTATCFHIASDEQMRTRLREELRTVLPSPTSPVTWSELERLPYLTGTVNESLRLGGFLTSRSPRIAPDQTLTYKEYTIPPGTPVSSSSYIGHKDPSIFPGPEKFSPERWISAGRNNEHLFKYITSFSRGSRVCVGMNLAFLELYMALAYYVRRFDIELVNTTVEDMRIVRDMGVGFTHRGEPSVYARIVKVYED